MTKSNLQLYWEWNARAAGLDEYARFCRAIGDTVEAADAEQAATDYRIAADALDVEAPAA